MKLAALLFVAFMAAGSLFGQSNVVVAVNKGDASLAIIDADTMKIVGKVPVGVGPHETALSPDGKTAYVSNYGEQTPGSSISMIDVTTRKEIRRVDVSPLMRPHGMFVIGGKLYFTAEVNRMIARYDPAANKLDWMMGTGQTGTHMIAGSADQRHFFTTNVGADSVSAFDFAAVPPSGSKAAHIPVGKQPEAIDLSPDGKEVWAGLNIDNGVDVIDTAAGKVVARINIGQRPYRVRFTPDGKQVVCTLPNSKEVVVYDAATRKELRRMKLDSVPLAVAISLDSKTAYFSVVQPDAILKIDLEKMTVIARSDGGISAPDGISYFGR